MTRGTQTIAGVERALDVLGLFADREASDLGVTEIAEALDLSKAVVHRILSSFRVKGFVELDEDTRRYRIGPRTLTVGMSYLHRLDKLDVARSSLIELSERTGETATQSVRAGMRAVYVAQVPSPRQIRVVVQLGDAHRLHVGSESKVLLAYAPPHTREAYVLQNDIDGDPDALTEELEAIRAQGHHVSFGEREPDAGAAAAPVLDHTGTAIAALTVSGPVERFREQVEDHVKVLKDVTERASALLGGGVVQRDAVG